MKKASVSIFSTLLLLSTFYLPNTLAQYEGYTQLSLPQGAKARLGKGGISEIAYSSGGTRLAVASSIGIWLYDAQTGEELNLFTGHTYGVSSVSFSPDGKILAGGTLNGPIRLWNVDTGTHIRTLTRRGASNVRSVSFSPDGETLAGGSSKEIYLWDVNTGTHIQTLAGHTDPVESVSFSPDGKTLASAGWDGTIRLWDARTGAYIQTFTGHTGHVNGVSFSPDGRTLVSGGNDTTVRVWNVDAGTHIRTLNGHKSFISSVSFSSDGTIIASGDWREIRLWDVNTGTHIQTLIGGTYPLSSLSFSPDGKKLASGSDKGIIRVWDVTTGKHTQILTGYTSFLRSVSFSPDGQTLVSGGDGAIIHVWDVNTGIQKQTLDGRTSIKNVSFSPDGRTIASTSSNTIRVWDIHTGTQKQTLTGHTGTFSSLSFSPNGRTLASGSYDGPILLWDAQTGTHIRTFAGHTADVSSLSFGPDGRTLASSSRQEIRLWDAQTGAHIRTFAGHTVSFNSLAFSPDGRTLASGSYDGLILLWNAHTGQHIRTLTSDTNQNWSVSFSPDGQTLASGSGGEIRLWDVQTGTHIRTFAGHTWHVFNVAFSPNGQTLASVSGDGTVLLWELTPSAPPNITPSATATLDTTVSLSPSAVQSPAIGQQLTLSLKITDGKNVAGYQATVQFDTSALRYVKSTNGGYLLSKGAFFVPPIIEGNKVTLAGTALSGESRGDGTLATLTFEVVAVKASTVRLSGVLLTDSTGGSSSPQIEAAEITEASQPTEDINADGVVNVQDLVLVASNFGKIGKNVADVNRDGVVNIVDLTLVAGALGGGAGAPSVWSSDLGSTPTRKQVGQWLHEARQMNLTNPTFQRGITMLEQLLAALTPEETALLLNYPNPFNPETWIPYQLAEPADVSISIYAADGKLIRTLILGHQSVGIYESRSRAAYWDGRNALGEPVASGVYFYTLTAGEFTATRKMLIMK